MNVLEERLRAALQAHAEDFQGHPDAWRRLQAGRMRRAARRRRLAPRASWPAGFVIPAAAAAAVLAIVVAAALVVNGVPGRTGTAGASRPTPARTPGPAPRLARPPYSSSGPPEMMLEMDPPSSAVIGLRVPWIGKKADKVEAYFWLGRNNPAFWLDQLNPGPQFCHDVVNLTGESSGFCWPLPGLGSGLVAAVTGSEGVGTDQTIMVGVAEPQVASVTAVLSDGRTYPGAVGTGRGLTDKAWTVGYPWTKGYPYTRGARLIFRSASGKVLGTLPAVAPAGPPQLTRPTSGGVRVYSYPASGGEPAGQVDAYLIDGWVGFWSPIWGGTISQDLAAGPPALAGLALPFGLNRGYHEDAWTKLLSFGYAHANVARITLRLPNGRQVSASMIAVPWPGLRLWTADLPVSAQDIAPRTIITATGYDAAGHVVGQVQLGQLE